MVLTGERFFLFGMGDRRKLIYRGGVLRDAVSGEIVRQWQVEREAILPSDYTVSLTLPHGGKAVICPPHLAQRRNVFTAHRGFF